MANEKYEIKIVMEAVSRVAPAMRSVSREADKMSAHFKAADEQIKKLDRHLGQMDAQVTKARDGLRSLNPPLAASATKFKTLSETLTGVNRNMGKLERESAKAGTALGALGGIIEKLEKKLNDLDAKMEKMGAKTYKPELDVSTAEGEAKIRKLKKDLASEHKKTYTSKFEFETREAEKRVEELTKFLQANGYGKDAKDIVGEIDLHFNNIKEWETKQAEIKKEIEKKREIEIDVKLGEGVLREELNILRGELKQIESEEVGIKALFQKSEFDRQRSEIYASILGLAGVRVHPEVQLDTKTFQAEYALVEGQLTALGLRREHVKVLVDMDLSRMDRTRNILEQFAERQSLHTEGLTRKIRDNLLAIGIVFVEPLISSMVGLAGALTAVALAASQAALALGGLAAAGIAQAAPMAGILIASLARVAGVIKAVSAAQAEKDKGTDQGAAKDLQAAGRADALRSAHEGLSNALRSQALAQEALNNARREGIRTLTDMKLAQERANITADESRLALASAAGTATGQSIASLELQARSDRIAANRQNIDTGRAVAGGVEGLPAVQSAKRALDDATRSVAAARRAIKQAEASFNQAASSQGAAANALAIALGKLTDSEKKLYRSVTRFRALFQKGGPLNAVTDPIISAFADGLDSLASMLKSPAVLGAATGLARAMGKSFRDFATFMTTGRMRSAFIFFAKEGEKNIGKITHVLEGLLELFVNIARAASGIFTQALEGTGSFLDRLVEKTGSPEGQKKLANFFKGAYDQLVSILKLSGAIIKFFAALAGAGGAEEGKRGIDGLTDSINSLTDRVNKNQDKVKKFFHDSITVVQELLSMARVLTEALIETFDPESVRLFADFFKDTLIPIFVFALKVLGEVSKIIITLSNNGIIEAIGKLFVSWLVLTKVSAFLTGIALKLGDLIGLAGRAGGALSKMTGIDLAKPFNVAINAAKTLLAKIGLIRKTPAVPPVIVSPGGKPGPGGTTTSPGGVIIPGGVKKPTVTPAPSKRRTAAKRLGLGALVAGGIASQNLPSGGSTLEDAGKESVLSATNSRIREGAGAILSADIKAFFNSQTRNRGEFKKFAQEADDSLKKLASSRNINGLKNLANEAKKYAKQFPDYAEALGQFAESVNGEIKDIKIENLNEKLSIVNDYLGLTSDTAGKNLSAIRNQFKTTAQVIENELGRGTARAKDAAQKNFELMAAAIRQSMKDGLISVRTGNREIKRLLAEQLKTMGFDEQEAHDLAFSGVHEKGVRGKNSGYADRAAFGGFIGNKGERGDDTVPILVGRGEAVLNWGHQKVVEPAMRAYYGIGLGEMFKKNKGRHSGSGPTNSTMYARGGYVQRAVGNPARGAAADLAQRMFAKGFNVTDANRPGRAGSSYHNSGNALDFGDSVNDLRKVWAALSPQKSKFAELFGPSAFAGLWHGNTKFSNAKLQAAHEDHVHVAVVNAVGRLGEAVSGTLNGLTKAPIIPRIKSTVGGVLGKVAQRALDLTRKAGNKRLREIFDEHKTAATTPDASAATTGEPRRARGGNPNARRIWNFMIGKGFTEAQAAGWVGNLKQESNWNPSAIENRGRGPGYGLAQWSFDRKNALFAYAKKRRKPWNDFQTQLDFIWAELQGPERTAYRAIKAQRRIKEATEAIGTKYERFGIEGVRVEPAREAYRQFHHKAMGGFIGGKPIAWGGAQANGGNYFVKRPTMFLAGEAGPEHASFTPMASAAAAKRKPTPFKTLSKQIPGLESDVASASSFDGVAKAAEALLKTLKKLRVNTKSGLDRLTKAIDKAAAEGGSYDKLIGQIDRRTRKRNAAGLSQKSTLRVERSEISATAEILDDEVTEARRVLNREIKKGKKKGSGGNKKAISQARGILRNLEESQLDLRERFNKNVEDTVSNINETYNAIAEKIDTQAKINERNGVSDFNVADSFRTNASNQIAELQGQLARVDKGSKFANPELAKAIQEQIASINASIADQIRGGTFNRVDTKVQLQQKKDDALGKNSTGLLDATIESTRQGIEALRARIKNDGSDIDAALREKIDEMDADLVGMVAERLQASIDAVNRIAEKRLAGNDLAQRFAQLGITRDQAIGGNYSIASLGRTDYGAVGSALRQRGGILSDQRTRLSELLSAAISQGNEGAIEELTKQIEELNIEVVNNIQAIRDNTDAQFDFAVGQSQEGNSFLLSLNQGAQAISSGLIAISGIADDATQLAILNQRQTQLQKTSKDDRGFLGQLLGQFGINVGNLGTISGNNLVPYLENLYKQALDSGALDDAQITTMKNLITAIINSETALLDNTKAIKDLNGGITQTFTSTAWTTFRQAIFDGNGGLLPQYSIPSMDTGGYVAKSGLFNLHAGEKVLRKDEVDNSHTIGEFHTHITNPTEVVDPYTLGPKIAWAMAGTGRN